MMQSPQRTMGKNLHFIIIPPPFQGHINPSIQLTLKLASKGFTITFVNTHSTHDKITKTCDDDVFAGARESGLDIRYRTISDGFPLTFDRSLNREQFLEGRLHVYPAHVDELVGQLSGSDHPPTCLVVDTFSTWGSNIAWKYGLVYVSFWVQPALALTVYYHHELLKKNGHYGCTDTRKDTIDYIPGVRFLEPTDLISFFQETDTSTAMHRLIQKAFADVKNADIIICNTMEELEPEAISVLKEKQTVYTIGPLFPSQFTDQSVEMDLWPDSDCSRWLDSKPPGSVLYASFGSYAHSNKEDIRAIADGIMVSGVSFIWVLRPGVVNCEAVDYFPDGFHEIVGNIGLVVPWCKQKMVLSHSAVGGYLTHCGWNSILESIWVGVPLICFPLLGDQTINRKLVVDDWKIGINLCEGKFVSGDQVAERIKLVMNRETSHVLKKNIEQVRKTLENAVGSNGTSRVNFENFVDDVQARSFAKN
ncbi:UDP-glycosyltransferase 86A1-like [Andrographis paniculata]|uniref:UDP-glycosyltransferase 86A1-like n=1 Tax=Andrographis paniculata TaxID=175694 RepID=UPI001E6EC342|nr:UDP-glycosyltransferase 86A1-like [Andrographis paniculata]QZJ84675.1 UDP-glycosyltransferase 4 [Andrographis paniculata]